jgi:hypothetical protein
MTAIQKKQAEQTSTQSSAAPAAAQQAGGPVSEWSTPANTGSLFQAQLEASSPGVVQLDSDPEKKEEAPADAGTASGLANYEATMGKWLGSKLYKAVADQITLAKLAGYANSGIGAAFGPLGDYIKGNASDVDPAQVDKAMAAMESYFGKQAESFVKANGAGFQKALQGFVDASPVLITILGMLAAAGCVAANMKIPELKAKVGIADGLEAHIAVKLGKLRDISLQKIEAKLTYKAANIDASFSVAYEDEEMSARLGLKYGLRDDLDLSLSGQWSEEDGAGGRLGMDYRPRDNVSIGAHVGYDDKKGANAGIGVTIRF